MHLCPCSFISHFKCLKISLSHFLLFLVTDEQTQWQKKNNNCPETGVVSVQLLLEHACCFFFVFFNEQISLSVTSSVTSS